MGCIMSDLSLGQHVLSYVQYWLASKLNFMIVRCKVRDLIQSFLSVKET